MNAYNAMFNPIKNFRRLKVFKTGPETQAPYFYNTVFPRGSKLAVKLPQLPVNIL